MNSTLLGLNNNNNNQQIIQPFSPLLIDENNNNNINKKNEFQQYGERVIDEEDDAEFVKVEEEDEDETIIKDFPFNIILNEMSATELPSVHRLSKNVPYVKLMCDNFYSKTTVFFLFFLCFF
jgi:hypothetical protein